MALNSAMNQTQPEEAIPVGEPVVVRPGACRAEPPCAGPP